MDFTETTTITHPNSCCSASLKLKCWLILAKYGASKLKLVEQVTQDAALDEFETRFALKKRFSRENCDEFGELAKNIFNQTSSLISEYVCSPDWTIFHEYGVDSMWQLNNIIRNETELTTTTEFPPDSHLTCLENVIALKEEIFTIVDNWSEITYTYWNYISAALSAVVSKRLNNFVAKYEQNENSIDEILRDVKALDAGDATISNERHDFWFLCENLNSHSSEDSMCNDYFRVQNEENMASLANRVSSSLFQESVEEFKSCTRQLLRRNDTRYSYVNFFDKLTLSAYLDVFKRDSSTGTTEKPTSDSPTDIRLSDGPHYSFDDYALIKLEPIISDQTAENALEYVREKEIADNLIKCENDPYFDSIDSLLRDASGDGHFDEKIAEIKVELNNCCEHDFQNENETECRDLSPIAQYVAEKIYNEAFVLPKVQILAKHEIQKSKGSTNSCSVVRHKKRGRPRKVDDNQSACKNGQHKYSPQNVSDCSTWISDNFVEIPGNKPAIDRARLYELYTNYCTLKFCIPVDRALFGKIIRKVFPELKSRRLIQNQVLKYHYVGLKPKYAELEHALLYSDSTGLQEILLSYDSLVEE